MTAIPDRASPADATGALGLRTVHRLIQLGERLKAYSVETLAPLEIRPRHYNVLMLVESTDAPSQQDLSRALGIDPNVMVSLIDDLEVMGLVRRAPNPRDRRRHAIGMTAAGRGLLRRANTLATAAEAAVLGQVSPDELAVLHDVAGRLLASSWETGMPKPTS
ncbi:MAG TPA: MarR family winged helix-turn-helix transcriptional regulator [Mycobacteriales bacterium]